MHDWYDWIGLCLYDYQKLSCQPLVMYNKDKPWVGNRISKLSYKILKENYPIGKAYFFKCIPKPLLQKRGATDTIGYAPGENAFLARATLLIVSSPGDSMGFPECFENEELVSRRTLLREKIHLAKCTFHKCNIYFSRTFWSPFPLPKTILYRALSHRIT